MAARYYFPFSKILPVALAGLLTILFAMTLPAAAAPELPPMTPCPLTVQGVQSARLDLNGTWEFAPADDAAFKPIEVPGEWAMQGFSVAHGAFAVYRRQIDIPADWQDMAIKLRFDAVHAVCKVEVNGKEIGGHEGGFVPFELDATTALKPGRNDLVVRVQSESVADSIACMNQYAAHQVGGILRKVTLFCVPAALHLADLDSHTTWIGSTARLQIRTKVTNGIGEALPVTHRLLDADGKELARGPGDCTLEIPAAKPWTSESPYLHTLESTCGKSTYRRKIGLREIKVLGNKLLINGSPVKLLGVNRHEVHPLRGRSLTPELCRKDAELFRAANVNLVRTSHYPPSGEFLDACDELGIFVECEAAVCWIKHSASPIWKTWNHLDPKYLPYFLRANLDNVAANRHHPSVIIWSLANESLWTPLFAETLAAVKQADPSRPVTFHDQIWGGFNNAGSKGDIANHHYPSENNPASWSQLPRPVWFGEYAHLQAYNRRELATDPGIRADWGRPLTRMVDLIWEQPGCLGGAIWSGIDDVFHMPDGNLKGYGHWGPIDGWRREKPEYHGVFTAYSPIKILKREFDPGKPIVLTVQNRFNFTNLAALEVRWSVPGTVRSTKPDAVAPGGIGTIVLPTGELPDDYAVDVVITDPRGVVVARECFRSPAKPAGPVDATTNPANAGISVDGTRIRLGKFTMPAPMPMVLPLNGEGGTAGPAGSVLANEIAPFTPLPGDWQPVIRIENNTCLIDGETSDLRAIIRITPAAHGGYTVDWEAKMKKDINPRQWGIVFTLPRAFDTLTWDRMADVSWYPDTHLARPRGHAKANPVVRQLVEEPGVQPVHPWAHDANALGTADFRSTKIHIVRAALGDGRTNFMVLSPDASQSTRAWVDGESIRLLVARYNTGGSDGFFATHYAAERRPLKAGDVIRSKFTISTEAIP